MKPHPSLARAPRFAAALGTRPASADAGPVPAEHMGGIAQALSIRYNNLVYDMKSRGEDVIVLSLGEAFFDIPLFRFDDLPMPDGYHYSHSRGVPELRRRLAAYYGERYGVPVDPADEILVTAGSKIAIHMSLMAILNPGDEAMVLEPAWVSYTEQVKLCHAVPVMVPHDAGIFRLGEFITARTRVIIVNNPNNPSGKLLTAEELAHLHELADEHGLFILSDEAYSDFVPEGRFISLGAGDPEKRHTLICNSMSKNHGMSGWRLGYVIGRPTVIDEVLKINQHLVTCPPTILQYYLERHFAEVLEITRPQIAEVVRRRAELAAFMDARGMTYLPGDSTFYFFVSIGRAGVSSEEFCTRLLTAHGVSTVPGIGYGDSCDGFIRVSVGTENMERTRRGIVLVDELIEVLAMENGLLATTGTEVMA
ncbi:pyridoxal phosphate-dependent aminotransferase [Longimicrobium terrae]|uniref:Aminotransferase n=1 Tax=Longimicrobium terrae TaxID=1639882 RepID=A0A841GUZ7_9BACT|nr:pyridoxal phosphate-dependent aminotransferase [Longimicrobium terrae]MBB4634036.1 aspartate aminotransferase/aminotransferase [Longimicrobium terrae]MBB6069074.1 aspartate aminotransferase/aminotransferase [Longimicrobium terrae]NNC28249.1 pyridoxal phosphate-dependent aminotransferase [Longimicrobium terrae]